MEAITLPQALDAVSYCLLYKGPPTNYGRPCQTVPKTHTASRLRDTCDIRRSTSISLLRELCNAIETYDMTLTRTRFRRIALSTQRRIREAEMIATAWDSPRRPILAHIIPVR